MTSQGRAVGVVALALSCWACSANRVDLPALDNWSRPESVFVAGEDFPSQRVFRVRFQGAGERGSFRVILRLENPSRYRLSAVDPVGRLLWEVEFNEPETLFLDHRNQVSCVALGPVAVDSVSLSVVPVDELPALLLGRLPVSLRDAQMTGESRLLDQLGRQWSVETDAGELVGWTIWQGDRPSAWFRRLEDGGILSHRIGEQFRWQQTVSEQLAEPLEPLPVPEGWRRLACSEMALVE